MKTRGLTIIEVVLILAIILILVAIAIAAYQKAKNPILYPPPVDEVPGFDVITDSVTGCQYLLQAYRYETSPVARMGADGKQICNPPTVEAAP